MSKPEDSPPRNLAAAARRLNWNPDSSPEDVTEDHVAECQRFGYVDYLWRCGNARIEPGQRLFLMRTGGGPRGLIGIGRAISVPVEVEDGTGDGPALRCVPLRLTVLSIAPLVPADLLASPPLDTVPWMSQSAAVRLSAAQAEALEALVGPFNDEAQLMADEIEHHVDYVEGAIRQVVVNGFERNQGARRACLEHWGSCCSVCSLDFAARYGTQFANLIHVHHVVPLSRLGMEYLVNPVKDLRPVCPNCHAMLHARRPDPLSVEELKSIVSGTIHPYQSPQG